MTIELTTEDLTEIMEQAARYGACILKTKTTTDEPVWIAIQTPRAAAKRRARPNAEPDAAAITQ